MKAKVSKVLSSPDYKVISVSGNAGDVLEKHKVNQPAILLVQKGTVIYQEEGALPVKLTSTEGHNIPPEVFHQVTCVDEAAIFVLIPLEAKMKFKR